MRTADIRSVSNASRQSSSVISVSGFALGPGDAGRVDQDVEVPADRVADGVGAGLAAQVGHDRAEPVAAQPVGLQDLDRERELVGVEIGHQDAGALLAQDAGRLQAHASGGAGDDRRAARNLEVHD